QAAALAPDDAKVAQDLAAAEQRGDELLLRFVVPQLVKGAGEELCRQALDRNPTLVNGDLFHLVAENAMMQAQRNAPQYARALTPFAGVLAERLGGDGVLGRVRKLQGLNAYLAGRPAEAMPHLRAARDLLRQAGGDGLIDCLNLLGLAASKAGDLTE